MKHLFALFLLLLVTGTAAAQRFQVGQMTFAVTSAADKTVAVTAYESTADDSDLVYIPVGSNRRSKAPAAGYDVEVPETVSYDGTTYSVTAIADNAFMGLYLMQSISLPATLQSVGKTAFCDCTSLKKIVCFATTPPHAASNAFHRVETDACRLLVSGSIEAAYKYNEVWRTFSFPTPKTYILTYFLDDALFVRKMIAAGSAISPEVAETTEDLVFTGWQGLPANLVMPAHDVTATGQFVKNPCAAPVVTLRDGKIVFTSATPGAKFHYTLGLKGFGVEATTDEEVEVPQLQFEVSVYATAEGYTASATTTETFDHCTLTLTPGDVNGDNEVSISDVAKLVNILLRK